MIGYGECSGGLDVHHITNKGAGGNDTPDNLVTLCRKHHGMAQVKKISPDELRATAQLLNAVWEKFVGEVPVPEDARD